MKQKIILFTLCSTFLLSGYSLPNDLIQQYQQIHWQTYTKDYQKLLNVVLCNEVSKILNIQMPNISYYSDIDLSHGQWIVGSDTIEINIENIDSAQYMFKTITHELRHLWQYQKTQNPITKEDFDFKNNYDNYTKPESDYAIYSTQIIEQDAESFTNELYQQVIDSYYQ